ncbi:MAG: bifunctional DNA-formamidopyrimidine glycosylase/DNA-(apurinic or apyrimidinic site) lyase [Acidimicrobiia bacterium]|nr:bifunctional DNA-formamidopyrimidine glycosylase/DNA-(apurinic or apyrimidinic site) lyase [Acidimicrobiia bacterium]
MPELPEVETTRRGLVPVLAGRSVARVEVLHPRMLRRQPDPADFVPRLRDKVVGELRRRGKFLLIEVGDGLTWVFHLGMSGRMSINAGEAPRHPHTRVVVRTDAGQEVRMVDPRTFGFTAVLTAGELAAASNAPLGPDALTALPSARELASGAAGRRVATKTLLLDQRYLAGLGNIYADEVLFAAAIAGDRPAGSLSLAEVGAIRTAIGRVLADGLEHGGTSLDDLAYLLPDGRAGRHLEYLSVYGREGKPCRRCGAPIVKARINGRSSHRCHGCQA